MFKSFIYKLSFNNCQKSQQKKRNEIKKVTHIKRKISLTIEVIMRIIKENKLQKAVVDIQKQGTYWTRGFIIFGDLQKKFNLPDNNNLPNEAYFQPSFSFQFDFSLRIRRQNYLLSYQKSGTNYLKVIVHRFVKNTSRTTSVAIGFLVAWYFCFFSENKSLDNTDSSKQEISQKFGSNIVSEMLSTHIKLPLLKLIAGIIQRKLCRGAEAENEISYSIIFKNCLLSFFLSILSQNSNLIGMDRLINLHKNLMAENYMLYMPIYLYFMYGGGLFTIQQRIFKSNFTKLINNLSYVLVKEQTIMTRNVEEIKTDKFKSNILSDSFNIVCCSTNKEYMEEISQKLCLSIFAGKDYIKKQDFCETVAKIPDNDKVKSFLFFYVNLLRLEFQISQQNKVQATLGQKQQKGKSSFYATEMQKILKKCPYNGDIKCGCKKCQCVRRNRQSAKLSQQKKRNAVEQLEPMKQKMIALESRNRQLQQQNTILKGLLNSFKNHPEFKSIMMNTIDPVSKILKDN